MVHNDKTGLTTPVFSPEQTALSTAMTEIMRPMMQAIGKMLEKNVEAIERLSAAQTIQNDRLEALEKQIRLQTPITANRRNSSTTPFAPRPANCWTSADWPTIKRP